MAQEKLITNTQLKKGIQGFGHDELVVLIMDIAQASLQAREFLTVKFSCIENANEVLEKYKQKIKNEFFPKRGLGRLNLREAKKAISDYRKICPDKAMEIDIMLFYVENCIEFTDQFGDINEAFYNSAVSVYGQVIKKINSSDIVLFGMFANRIKLAAINACKGWGFQDDMLELYCQIVWLEENDIFDFT